MPQELQVEPFVNREDCYRVYWLIDDAMVWSETPQGQVYWSTVAEHLGEFYRNHYLSDVVRDLRSITIRRRLPTAIRLLEGAFDFGASPQGSAYWNTVIKNLRSNIQGNPPMPEDDEDIEFTE